MKSKAVSVGEIRDLLLRLRRKNPKAHAAAVDLLRSLFGDKKSPK